MTALRLDAVASVKVVHRIYFAAEAPRRHSNVYEVREVLLEAREPLISVDNLSNIQPTAMSGATLAPQVCC